MFVFPEDEKVINPYHFNVFGLYLQFIYLQIISDLQPKVARLDNESSRVKSALDEANDENQELNEELERVKSDQPLAIFRVRKRNTI